MYERVYTHTRTHARTPTPCGLAAARQASPPSAGLTNTPFSLAGLTRSPGGLGRSWFRASSKVLQDTNSHLICSKYRWTSQAEFKPNIFTFRIISLYDCFLLQDLTTLFPLSSFFVDRSLPSASLFQLCRFLLQTPLALSSVAMWLRISVLSRLVFAPFPAPCLPVCSPSFVYCRQPL